jgi:hypothetical protein
MMRARFLYLYSGGTPPQTEAQGKAMMEAWIAYFNKIAPAILDGGAPFGPTSKTLGPAAASKAMGYSIVQAENLAAAAALTDGHPHLASGGGIEIFELVDLAPA